MGDLLARPQPRVSRVQRKRPTKNVQALLDHIGTSGDPIFWLVSALVDYRYDIITWVRHVARQDQLARRPPPPRPPRARAAGHRDPRGHHRPGQRLRQGTSAPTSAPSSSPSPSTGSSTRPTTSSCGTPATRRTCTSSSPAAATSSPRCGARAASRATRHEPGVAPRLGREQPRLDQHLLRPRPGHRPAPAAADRSTASSPSSATARSPAAWPTRA